MSDLKPCPFCGQEHQVLAMDTLLFHVIGHAQSESDWNRRTPGPATKAMIAAVGRAICDIEQYNRSGLEVIVDPNDAKAFLAEWSEQGDQ